jgi:hypothetical protein
MQWGPLSRMREWVGPARVSGGLYGVGTSKKQYLHHPHFVH